MLRFEGNKTKYFQKITTAHKEQKPNALENIIQPKVSIKYIQNLSKSSPT